MRSYLEQLSTHASWGGGGLSSSGGQFGHVAVSMNKETFELRFGAPLKEFGVDVSWL